MIYAPGARQDRSVGSLFLGPRAGSASQRTDKPGGPFFMPIGIYPRPIKPLPADCRLTEIGLHHKDKKQGVFNWYQCSCGNKKVLRRGKVRSGKTKSCGCLQNENRVIMGKNRKSHGESKPATPEYLAWFSMKRRCINKNHKGWKNYGGRGIYVCDRWKHSYENFLADVGRRPSPHHSLDRINNDGIYEPGNCRWATAIEQNNNRTFGRRQE